MQYLAVTAPGPLLVVAGAGSGKTQTLVHRIATLLERGADPSRVLVLTFSRKAAAELRARLERMLPAAAHVAALTFHAWALLRLRARGRRFRIVDRAEARVLVRRCLQGLGRPAGAASVAGHLDAISRAKGRLATPSGPVASCYADALSADGALDLDDLILQAIGLDEGGRYDHVLVDEFQDTSVAQFELLRRLVGPETDVCVVGDEDQAIYEWRSADPTNVRRFREAFPRARVVTLAENYRSTAAILDAANAVIARNAGRVPKLLVGARLVTGAQLTLIEAADERDEANALADLVREELTRVAPSDVAILFRVNAQALALERAFLARDIPHAVVRGVAFSDRAQVRDALALLRLVRDEEDDAAFRRAARRLVKGIGPVALERLAREGHLLPAARRGVLPPRYAGAITRLIATVDGLRTQGGSLVDLVRSAWRTLGHADDPDSLEGELVATLLELARDAPSLDALLDAVLVLDDPEAEPARDAVSLMTLHAAKGLEFSLVCIAGMEEGLLPHRRALDDDRELAEERRLCYVGMTRAKDRLVLSYAHARVALAGLSLGAPSRFLEDLPGRDVARRRTTAARGRRRAILEPRMGERVRHPRWGEGVVERIEDEAGAAYVTIRFVGRTRRMRTEYAPLERIE